MSCALAIVSLCLLDPSYTELRGDASKAVGGDVTYWVAGRRISNSTIGQVELSTGGALTRSVDIRYGFRHTSLIGVSNDKGDNRAFVGLTWRPFK